MKKIMLIDDEEDIRTIGEMSLVDVGGFEVTLVASGAEALERVVSDPPDLIILDVMMPGMDGVATFDKLRATPASREMPVIFMTAKVQKDEVARYMALGAAGVIGKPFDPMTLPDEIRKIMGQHPGAPS